MQGPAKAQRFGDADPGRILSDAPAPIAMDGTVQLAALSSPPLLRPLSPDAIPHAVPAPEPTPAVMPAPSILAPPPVASTATVDAAPRGSCLNAVRGAEARYDLPGGLLVAIALNESGLHAYAMSVDGRSLFPPTRQQAAAVYRGARGSVMAGCLQVNARVHARGDDWPLDPDRAADWAGQFLREAYARTGSWAEAIRLWHGGRPGSARWLACRIRAKMDVTAPDSGLFTDLHCGSGWQAARRNGQAHYEVALAE